MCFKTFSRILHRDLHCKNILIDPKLTHATLIDMDLMCLHGNVTGLDADVNPDGPVAGLDMDKNLQQVWPLPDWRLVPVIMGLWN